MNIILVPGAFEFSQLDPDSYFKGVANHLQSIFTAIRVLPTVTAPGTIADRASWLAQQILEGEFVGRLDPRQQIHIVAHSLGGLVSRFLVAKNIRGLGRRVATITTIGTPHFGSPIAAALDFYCSLSSRLKALGISTRLLDQWESTTARDLSSAAIRRFDADCLDDPRVQYFEVAGIGRDHPIQTSLFLLPSFLFMRAIAGLNDGLVAAESATRKRKPIAIWPADHADLIGHDLDRPIGNRITSFPHLDAYERLIRLVFFSARSLNGVGACELLRQPPRGAGASPPLLWDAGNPRA